MSGQESIGHRLQLTYLIPYVTSALQPPHSQPFGGSSFLVLQKRDINWQQSARVAHTHARQTCTLFTATLRQVRNRRPWCCRGCKPRSPRTWRRLSLSRTWRPLLYYLRIKDNVGFSEMAASERESTSVTWRTSGSRPAIRELYSTTVDAIPLHARIHGWAARGLRTRKVVLGTRWSSERVSQIERCIASFDRCARTQVILFDESTFLIAFEYPHRALGLAPPRAFAIAREARAQLITPARRVASRRAAPRSRLVYHVEWITVRPFPRDAHFSLRHRRDPDTYARHSRPGRPVWRFALTTPVKHTSGSLIRASASRQCAR